MIARTIKTPRTIAKIATEEMGALNGSIRRRKNILSIQQLKTLPLIVTFDFKGFRNDGQNLCHIGLL